MAPGPDDEAPYPPASYAWFVVGVLTLAYMLSFIDRQILALLIQPIKRDLGLSDTAISLLLGLAFGIFYAVLGLPLGRLADSRSRRAIVAVGIAVWCVMTMACGLAANYGQLFAARIGVGVGEAALAPAALSIISDYFPRDQRGRAISVYNGGISLGVGLAMVLGGQLVQYVSTAPPVTLPIVGELRAWQSVFLAVGLPGLLVAALMLTVREPVRRGRAIVPGGGAGAFPVAVAMRHLARRWRSFAGHFVGMSIVTILGYAYFAWWPTVFLRTWHWTIAQISLAYGLMLIVFAPVGVIAGGWYADWLFRRGYKDAHIRATLFGAIVVFVPWQTLAPLMPDPVLALVVLVPAIAGGSWCTATGIAALLMVVPNQMRGQATALYYLVISILGLTVGPSAVALATDHIFHDENALRYSLALVCGLGGLFGIAILAGMRRHYLEIMNEAERAPAAGPPAGSQRAPS